MSTILSVVDPYNGRGFYNMEWVGEISFSNGCMRIAVSHPKRGLEFSSIRLFEVNTNFNTAEFADFLQNYGGCPEGFKASFIKKFEVSSGDRFLAPFFFENIESYLRMLTKIGASRGGREQRW